MSNKKEEIRKQGDDLLEELTSQQPQNLAPEEAESLNQKEESLKISEQEPRDLAKIVQEDKNPNNSSSKEKSLLEVKNLSKFYYSSNYIFFSSKDIVVDRVSFKVKRGEIFGITGNNSCGKSTIAEMLSGAIKPDNGKIIFDGRKLEYGDTTFRREHIRLANHNLVETFNLPIDVNDFLSLSLEIIDIQEEFRAEIILHTFEQLGASPSLGTKMLSQLNKQEQALVSLAHALICKPDILVVDDLFANVDLSFKGVLVNILLDLQQGGTTIILVTSDLGIIKHLCDRVMILQDGTIEDIGNTYDVLTSSESEFTKLLIKSYFGRAITHSDWKYPLF